MSQAADVVAPVAPIKLRSLSEGEVQRFNTLVGEYRPFPFTWAGKPARLHFTRFEPAGVAVGWLRVRLGDHGIDLGLSALPEPSSLDSTFAGIELALLPGELLLGMLEVWLEEPIAELQRHGITFALEAWRTTHAPAAPVCGWELAWDGRDRFLSGTLHAEAEAMMHLANFAHRTPPTPRHSADALGFAVSVALAHVAMPLDTAESLTVGDVVLLPLSPAELAQEQVELWSAGRQLGRALKQGRKVKLLTMNPTTDAPAAPLTRTPRRVDDLPVHVVFDVGQIELSVGQLRTLGEGYTFELPDMPDRIVTIRVNGRDLGKGELVEVGDKVGVRIVTWTLA